MRSLHCDYRMDRNKKNRPLIKTVSRQTAVFYIFLYFNPFPNCVLRTLDLNFYFEIGKDHRKKIDELRFHEPVDDKRLSWVISKKKRRKIRFMK